VLADKWCQILAEVIGKGGYGMVYKGLHKTKGNFVAIKQLVLPRHSIKGQLDSLMVGFITFSRSLAKETD